MTKDIAEIQKKLKSIVTAHLGPLKILKESETNIEFAGTIEVLQGKQMVDGHYFCSIMPKPKDVRFYFFPIYTHVDKFSLSTELHKLLKGKSCFHVKYLTEELENELKEMVKKGIEVYQQDGIITNV